MKKIRFIISLVILIIAAPPAAIAAKMTTGLAEGKPQTGLVEVILEKYGVRHFSEDGRLRSIGLYKIIIGDPQELESAMSLNKSNGFDGLIYTTYPDNKINWHIIRVHRPVKDRKGWKETSIVRKNRLPNPFRTMDDNLLEKIQFFNVYPDNNNVTVVYVNEGTAYSECKKIFDYVYENAIGSK